MDSVRTMPSIRISGWAIIGLVFGVVIGSASALRSSRAITVLAATVFGFVLWIVNFYLITAIAFDWFKTPNQTVQFFAHTFFFGSMHRLLFAASWKLTAES